MQQIRPDTNPLCRIRICTVVVEGSHFGLAAIPSHVAVIVLPKYTLQSGLFDIFERLSDTSEMFSVGGVIFSSDSHVRPVYSIFIAAVVSWRP